MEDKKEEMKEPETKAEAEVQLSDLVEQLKTQSQMIEELKSSKPKDYSQTILSLEDKFSRTQEDIQNLTNILGGLAKKEEEEDIDFDEPVSKSKFKDLYKAMRTEEEQEQTKAQKVGEEKYRNDYISAYKELLADEVTPDGSILDGKAKDAITDLLESKFNIRRTNTSGAVDMAKNFRLAYRSYFKLDKNNPFKGGELKGAGVGGENVIEATGARKKVAIDSKVSRFATEVLGKDEEWASKTLAGD